MTDPTDAELVREARSQAFSMCSTSHEHESQLFRKLASRIEVLRKERDYWIDRDARRAANKAADALGLPASPASEVGLLLDIAAALGITCETDTATILSTATFRIEALSAKAAELELTAETAMAQAKSALALLEPLRASRRERDRKIWRAGFKARFAWQPPYETAWASDRCTADLDALDASDGHE